MADNVTVDNGALTDYVAAADDIGSGVLAQIVKLAISTDGSATMIPADGTNGMRVTPSVRKTRIAVTPTVSSSPAYSLLDQVGGLMTFSNAALSSGGSGLITSAHITCRAANTVTPDLDLVLYEASPTLAGSDNAGFDITDANRESGRELPVIKFRTADYVTSGSNTACAGRCNDGQPAIDFITSGSASLFGALIARSTFTLASTTDIVVALRILQD